ncbi:hypothetical protein BLNAU_20725 [Blattamonas nauphoetae]|uniref:Uncharacterized protein n=1 Tax=Blattamonas nauphoetae TaxID=2049346 RepID=A0ABQ9WXT3_9EUKA|nr:hypothetical protein BLNAU_20725 [Blattamonas nauphoetae]
MSLPLISSLYLQLSPSFGCSILTLRSRTQRRLLRLILLNSPFMFIITVFTKIISYPSLFSPPPATPCTYVPFCRHKSSAGSLFLLQLGFTHPPLPSNDPPFLQHILDSILSLKNTPNMTLPSISGFDSHPPLSLQDQCNPSSFLPHALLDHPSFA